MTVAPDDHDSFWVDEDLCMGAGYCYRSFPEVFVEQADGTSRPSQALDHDHVRVAALASAVCPAGAIVIHQHG
ncbi:ferredoxin [Arthrobacter sp. SLBN-53]|uniref:ferredoxin n=1 Tax=Arthrobacter sp. SLBN-53 TaxID=2768412 RepID=UPI0011505CC7